MKIKIAIVILAIACVGLGITLFATKKQSDEQHTAEVTSTLELSNQLVGATIQLNDFRVANVNLTNDLASSRQQLALTEQQAGQQAEQLSNSLAAARDQITNLNTHVSDLETQNKVLDQRASELTNTIAQLSAAIENTQNRLAVAETNRAFIEQELQKQMAQKAELEHKFNDLNEVRAQVKKLRDEIFIARRIQLMENDNGQKKGAELLRQRTPAVTNPSAATAGHQTNYNLNVEVGSDGSLRVIPPLNSATNGTAH